MRKYIKWNQETIEKLINTTNKIKNIKEIAKIMDADRDTIKTKCKKLNIIVGNFKKYKKLKEELNILNSPEIIYFLGLFWADGHLDVKRNTGIICLTKADFKEIEVALKTIDSDINIIYSQPKCKTRNCKEIGRINLCDKEICAFLMLNDYHIKSGASPDKILSKIPEHLRHYWWRGYFDGDGYFGKKHLSITSCLDQDWTFVKTLNNLNITFSIYKNKNKTFYSSIYISNEESIRNFSNYIYQNYENDRLGLSRKYKQFTKWLDYKSELIKKHSTGIKYICKYLSDGNYYYQLSINNKKLKYIKGFTKLELAIKDRNRILSEHQL